MLSDGTVIEAGLVIFAEGRCYGLVGPGYTSAEVADRMLGGAAEFPEAARKALLPESCW